MQGNEVGNTPSALMSLVDVARYLGMKERTIYEWAQSGRIPAFKLGATWRFRQSEIDAWLETQRTGSRPPLVPPVEPPVTSWQAHRARLEACREEIEITIRDESRTVFVIDQFIDSFGDDVVCYVVEQLQREGRITVSEVEMPDGEKVKVISRRS